MNDPRPPLTDDELSAHLDGEAAPDVAERLAADPEAAARLEQLRGAAATLGAAPVTPLAADVVDDLVGRAVAAADRDAAPDAVVAPLRPSRRSFPSVLVAAVVLVLVAAGLGLVWSGTHGGDPTDTASKGATAERQADQAAPEASGGGSVSTTAAAGSGGDSGGSTASGAASTPPTTAAADVDTSAAGVELPDLGAFETPEALRSSLATAFPATAPTGRGATDAGPLGQTAIDRCAGLLVEVLPVTGDPTHVGFAQVAGQTVLVYEFTAEVDAAASTTTVPGAAPTTLTTAVRPQACDPLFVFQR